MKVKLTGDATSETSDRGGLPDERLPLDGVGAFAFALSLGLPTLGGVSVASGHRP
ncbi:MAG: hypothetical protein IPO88_32360 [Nannocystis sp.]|uniref:hypothetical protein n=1 Tax=Nannocystis sp. TaxID=1962667 RepID=UPI0024282088|nr:hypothetical protein [Nannocystis sp.]MBK9758129.1 hypothetical protein [Nannocystis sp.]